MGMLLPLSRRKTVWAAYCDACLIGSPVVTFDAPHLSRAWAVSKLRALGWLHVAPRGLPDEGHRMSESAWTGETFCIDCASNQRMRKQA